MEQSRILMEGALPQGTAPELAEEAAALLQEIMAQERELAEPEVSVGAERASAEIALVIDALVTYAPQVVTVAAGATTVLKAIEAAKGLFAKKSKERGLTPAERLVAELPVERLRVVLDDGTTVPVTELAAKP